MEPSLSPLLNPDGTRPKKRSSSTPAQELIDHAVEAALSKKATDVVVMDLRPVDGPAEFFVLCTGTSDLQIKAIADAVDEQIREEVGERPWHVEGYAHKQWVLLDYVDVVVHVFDAERRAYYNLERLWADAEVYRVEDEAGTHVGSTTDAGVDPAPATDGSTNVGSTTDAGVDPAPATDAGQA